MKQKLSVVATSISTYEFDVVGDTSKLPENIEAYLERITACFEMGKDAEDILFLKGKGVDIDVFLDKQVKTKYLENV